jgi:lipopolysaccharide/colanic/teichoic acid biosynthesis glycosyltransferase
MKRIVDLTLVLSTAWLTLPLLVLTGLLVFLMLGRPVLFRQDRSGKASLPFRMVKFRSMTDARGSDGELLPDAQRTPAFGRLLRRSRLDELPEILNIVRGEMALVGPRPLLPQTIARLAARGMLRSSVPPGLTGWAQVSGNSMLSEDEKLDLDLWYIRNRTWILDARILLATASVMVFGERPNRERLVQARLSSEH